MLQLLPELRDIFNEFSDGVKRYDKEPPENREWDDLKAVIREVDAKADRIKDDLIRDSPDFLIQPFPVASKANEYSPVPVRDTALAPTTGVELACPPSSQPVG